MAGRSAEETRRLKTTLRALLAGGASEQECLDTLQVTPVLLRRLRQELIAAELSGIQGEPLSTQYIRFKLRMDECIEDLNDIIEDGKKQPETYSSVVTATKAKATLLEKVFDKGQEFGIITLKVVEAETTFEGVALSKIAVEDLEDRATEGAASLKQLHDKFGTVDYVDEEEEELYFDEPAKETA
jgi:hypothetical protein